MSLEIINLTKSYGAQTALNNINLNIDNNEIIGLLGPNGAGKSTLMKSIVGALSYNEGQIVINGEDLQNDPIALKKAIGFLPEDNPLYMDMYVKEFLSFGCNIHDIPKQRVNQVINLVGLNPEQHKKAGQLSKGYKQRLGLAQAILHDPEILVLDEPTNGLDPNQILEIRQLIKTLGKAKTIILSTHIMQEVEALCDRVILIHQGNILQDAPISDFKGRYQSLEEAFATYTSGHA